MLYTIGGKPQGEVRTHERILMWDQREYLKIVKVKYCETRDHYAIDQMKYHAIVLPWSDSYSSAISKRLYSINGQTSHSSKAKIAIQKVLNKIFIDWLASQNCRLITS